MSYRIIHADVLDGLRELPAESVHMVVTSPPYWALRSYLPEGHADKALELGAEELHDCLGWATGQKCGECYICHMVGVFTEVRRVLRKDGTCWINIGDSYAGAGGSGANKSKLREGRSLTQGNHRTRPPGEMKPKDLCGMPWRLALALQADGWWLRDIIVWDKPAPMPESVRDRCTKSWEPILMLSKSERYYFDGEAIREEQTGNAHSRGNGLNPKCAPAGSGIAQNESFSKALSGLLPIGSGRNKRNLWRLPPMPTPDAHFATFPLELPETCLMAGTSERGVCPTCAAPWRRIVDRPTSGDWHPDKEAKGNGVQRIGKNGTQHAEAMQRRLNDSTAKARANGAAHDSPFGSATTLGWEPTCKCMRNAIDATGVCEASRNGKEWESLADSFATAFQPGPATILDPFCGAGTTILAALKNGRQAIGIELSAEYIAIAEKRILRHMPLMAARTSP